jgi:hypothetical protein
VANLRTIGERLCEEINCDVVERGTTGANPGRTPDHLRFQRSVPSPQGSHLQAADALTAPVLVRKAPTRIREDPFESLITVRRTNWGSRLSGHPRRFHVAGFIALTQLKRLLKGLRDCPENSAAWVQWLDVGMSVDARERRVTSDGEA